MFNYQPVPSSAIVGIVLGRHGKMAAVHDHCTPPAIRPDDHSFSFFVYQIQEIF
jgi:hypothetical protein